MEYNPHQEVVKELEKCFISLGETIKKFAPFIKQAKSIKKASERDEYKYHDIMAELSLRVDLFNDGIDNVVNFIRTSGLGDLEDMALYLESIKIKNWGDTLSENSFFEGRDLDKFIYSLSMERFEEMLRNLTQIAINDQNPNFLRSFRKTSLVV